MSTGRGTHDTDKFAVDIPLFGIETGKADGAFGIQLRRRVTVCAVAFCSGAVFENQSGNAVFVEELGVVDSLVGVSQSAVSSAGADDHCGGAFAGIFRQIDFQRGNVAGALTFGKGGITLPEPDFFRSGKGKRAAEAAKQENFFHHFVKSFLNW